jgi:glutathione synthase/RimK-type ligase-like ATP-grasp enzyme
VAEAVDRLMRALRLRFGALDLIVAPDDEHWFLEVNPNGQWGWIEDATGLPIAASIADALQRE